MRFINFFFHGIFFLVPSTAYPSFTHSTSSTSKDIRNYLEASSQKELLGITPIRKAIPFNENITLICCNIAKHLSHSKTPVKSFSHTGKVLSVAVSHDGSKILTGSKDRRANLWNAHRGNLIHTFRHSSNVVSVAISHDDSQVATGSWDHTAKLWNAQNGMLLMTFNHTDCVTYIAFNDPLPHIITGGGDSTAKLWDAITGDTIHTFNHNRWVNFAILNTDHSQILSGSRDCRAKLWDVMTGNLIHTFKHNDSIMSAAFNADNSLVLTGSEDFTAKLWLTSTGILLHTFKHPNWVCTVAFSPNGLRILTGCRDLSAGLWDTHSKALIKNFKHTSPTPSPSVNTGEAITASFNNNGSVILTAAVDGTATLCDVQEGNLIHTFIHAPKIRCVAQSSDGSWFVTGSSDQTAKLWDSNGAIDLYNFLQSLTIDQADLLKAFEITFKIIGRIQATHDQWHTFKSFPPLVQDKLQRRIKAPAKINLSN